MEEDIPTWISEHSIVYKGIIDDTDENDESDFFVDKKYVKPLIINNISDFGKMIEIINYWDIRPIPKLVIDYIHENKKHCVEKLYELSFLATSKDLLPSIFEYDYRIEYYRIFEESEIDEDTGIEYYTHHNELRIYLCDNLLSLIGFFSFSSNKDDNYFDEIILCIENNKVYSDYVVQFDNFHMMITYSQNELKFSCYNSRELNANNVNIAIPINEYNIYEILKNLKNYK